MSLFTIIVAKILYTTLQRDIGLKPCGSSEFPFFGIKAKKVALKP